ncbi:hypothetical protein AB835_06670 [Candidatus Endobugula sertula]|uniref:Uncharacterized protein n=1 Tax=Candidatus Endobugula sertula TaxID=62101 RepID=A0A1D2QQN3_9GAMM|nr:hypothetical protein AB835_06670 [Candidatus Endobugula sertula]
MHCMPIFLMSRAIKCDVGGTTPSEALRYISHAGVGCVLGAVTAETTDEDRSNSCAAGAGGAVIGELIADTYRSKIQVEADLAKVESFLAKYGVTDPTLLSDLQREELLSIYGSETALVQASQELASLRAEGIKVAEIGAALGAFLVGADAAQINIAANAGANAAEHNGLAFLIPVTIFLLKAADIAITAYDLNKLKDDYQAAITDDAKKEVLKKYFGDELKGAALEIAVEKAFQKILPGATLAETLFEFAVDRGMVSEKHIEKVRRAFVPEDNLNTHTAGNNTPFSNTKFANQAEADEAFKQYEVAKNTDSEIVLGRLPDTEAGSQLGMTRLNSNNWSENVNDAFVQGGIDAGKPFYLGSSPDISNYRAAWNALEGNRGNHPQTVFFREMKQLRDAGYRLEGDYMVPPK